MKRLSVKTGKFTALLLSLTVLISMASGTGISFAERVKGTAPDYNEVTKESFENANGGTTYYIKFYDPSIYPFNAPLLMMTYFDDDNSAAEKKICPA